MGELQERKTGNIYGIPLPNGFYAFGRLLNDLNTLAVAKGREKDINSIPDFKDIDFCVAVYNDVLTDGEWPVLSNIPFKDDEDDNPPLQYMKDSVTKAYKVYYPDGTIKEAHKEDCIGLERVAAWDRNHVVERLMGDDSFTDICHWDNEFSVSVRIMSDSCDFINEVPALFKDRYKRKGEEVIILGKVNNKTLAEHNILLIDNIFNVEGNLTPLSCEIILDKLNNVLFKLENINGPDVKKEILISGDIELEQFGLEFSPDFIKLLGKYNYYLSFSGINYK